MTHKKNLCHFLFSYLFFYNIISGSANIKNSSFFVTFSYSLLLIQHYLLQDSQYGKILFLLLLYFLRSAHYLQQTLNISSPFCFILLSPLLQHYLPPDIWHWTFPLYSVSFSYLSCYPFSPFFPGVKYGKFPLYSVKFSLLSPAATL